jgi:hypothetical protein
VSERTLALAALIVLSACARGLTQAETPAVIDNPTDASRAVLVAAVRAALNGTSVTLAEDALTRDDVLIIEPLRPRDARGTPLSGRDLDHPEHFRLVKVGAKCILVHERTGERQALASTRCRAKSPLV